MQRRRKYSNEFKLEAVRLTSEPGVSVAQIARDLGINAGLLGKWRSQYRKEGNEPFPGKGHARDEELARLKRELSRVKKERDFLNDTFGQYVSREVRDEILSGRVTLKGELKEVTVLFSDLRDFTKLTETISPQEVVTVINTYFKSMSEAITSHHGLILQFVGDEIQAVFGAPVALENHQQCAMDAALEMRTRLSRVNLNLINQGYPALDHGIGLHTGKVVAANIGSPQRLSYTMMGKTMNIASRIQELNKKYKTDLLISAAVRKGVKQLTGINPLKPIVVKGISEPLQIYQIEKESLAHINELNTR